jgi:tetratricopeptide (TPR) repeat protein
MNNKFFYSKHPKIGLIALSLMGTIALSISLNFTINPVLAQNNININESKKAQAEKLYNEGMQLPKQGSKDSLEQAIIKLQQALTLYQEINDRIAQAYTLTNMGGIYSALGEKQQALEYFQLALPLSKAVSVGDSLALANRQGEATTLNNIASIEYDQGNLQTALTNIKSAIAIIENLGSKIISKDLRKSYFANVENYYKLQSKILMKLQKNK